MLKRLFEKKSYEDYDLGTIKRYGGLWVIPFIFQGQDVKVRFIGSDYFGPNKKALKKWKEYSSQINEIWTHSKEKIVSEFGSEKYHWNSAETDFGSFDIVVYDGKENKDIVVSFEVVQDDKHYYNACHLNGKIMNLERVCY